MTRWKIVLLWLLWFCLLASFGYAESEYVIEDQPEWVKSVTFPIPETIPEEKFDRGVYYLLVDNQVLVKETSVENFYRTVKKVDSPIGVQSVSQVSIVFDPSYQRVILHKVLVHRERQSVNQLNMHKINVIQREKDLEKQIYDGRKTINIILDDVRVGDIVECSYTIVGSNPVFDGLYFDFIAAGWRVGVEQFYARVLFPIHRKLYIKNHQIDIDVKETKTGQFVEYEWEKKQLEPIRFESGVPSVYSSYPWIQLSETKTWGDVINWALKWYRSKNKLSDKLKEKINDIRQSSQTDAEKLLKTLHFVQDEVRYMGIEMGPDSHAPSDPSVVFSRRFGDCKDKSFLMVTMLFYLNIEAYPAFVNTYLRKNVSEYHPTPYAFNHVIVYVRLNGKDYWLDPTNMYQRGDLEHIYQASYGKALVVNNKMKNFLSMSRTRLEKPFKSIFERYNLQKGVEKRAFLEVKTIYRGYEADNIRYAFARSNVHQMQKKYIDYYGSTYKRIETQEEMTLDDDVDLNEITVTEKYIIDDLWKKDYDNVQTEAYFGFDEVHKYLHSPKSLKRSMPFRLPFPVNVEKTIDVFLPQWWEIEDEVLKVNNKFFAFQKETDFTPNTKQMHVYYHFETRRGSVPPKYVKKYVDAVQEVNSISSNSLCKVYGRETLHRHSKGKKSDWLLYTMLVLLCVVAFFGVWMMTGQ